VTTPALGSAPSRDVAARSGLSTARAILNAAVPEADFMATVIAMAERFGWRWHHETDSRRTNAGWPDLVLVKPPALIVVELKAQKGRTTPEQDAWLADLGACPGVWATVWRPSDLDAIERALRAA